jgi:hypothetical protein
MAGLTGIETLSSQLRAQGYARAGARELAQALDLDLPTLATLAPTWDRLPRDRYLLDGGRYRARRHSSFVQDLSTDALEQAPHRAHWQPKTYNALHGGLERLFEPIEETVHAAPAFRRLIVAFGRLFERVRPATHWYIEAHQFRIDTTGGIGRPTPEGAHRDGVDFVALLLIARRNVRGGETRVFEAEGERGVRFTMTEPLSALLLDDARVVHETTPLQPEGGEGARDTLVLTYRSHGFLSPDTAAD